MKNPPADGHVHRRFAPTALMLGNIVTGCSVLAPAGKHSAKPEEIHDRIERLVGSPYLEMFAREDRPGWTVVGDEKEKFKGKSK